MICPSFWEVFRGGHAFFDPFRVKINVYGATIRPIFFVLSFLWFFDLFFLLLSSYSSLLIFKLFKLFLSLFINHIMSPDPRPAHRSFADPFGE
jgi:hypothetical protein